MPELENGIKQFAQTPGSYLMLQQQLSPSHGSSNKAANKNTAKGNAQNKSTASQDIYLQQGQLLGLGPG